jgi:hypothetical protein
MSLQYSEHLSKAAVKEFVVFGFLYYNMGRMPLCKNSHIESNTSHLLSINGCLYFIIY